MRRRFGTALVALGAAASLALVPATSVPVPTPPPLPDLPHLTTSPYPDNFAAECDVIDPEDFEPLVGTVGCVRLPSHHMGTPVPVGYWIPPACDPAQGRDCPVLYYLHGTGGSYREGAGTAGSAGSAWVRALTSGPPVDPRTVDDPWRFSNTSTWVPRDPIDLIIVSPHGRTLPGGHGPAAGADTGWFDWHPRYARDGDTPRYDTPPPEPSSFLHRELIPFVDATFPTAGTRDQRGILGFSQGGFGAYINGLLHPDTYATMGMRSGGALPVPFAGLAPSFPVDSLGFPIDLPHVALPGLVPSVAPDTLFKELLVAEATVGWGDLVADHAWFRASNPVDLLPNARAWAGDRQSLHLQHFVNDAVLRRTEDFQDFNHMALIYEAILYPTNLYLEELFDHLGIERTWHVGPGDHSSTYGVPYFREQLEGQYAHMRHWDGGGNPAPPADRFDYRTVHTDVSIWDWQVQVNRDPVEFLDLTDVTCDGLTLRGSGTVTVTVPARCGTGLAGHRTFTVTLGPSVPVNEQAGISASDGWGHTVRVDLDRTRPCPPRNPHCT